VLLADKPLLAAVATCLIWGVWHYPIILAGYERYESTLLGLLVFPVVTVLMSVILGWLRLRRLLCNCFQTKRLAKWRIGRSSRLFSTCPTV